MLYLQQTPSNIDSMSTAMLAERQDDLLREKQRLADLLATDAAEGDALVTRLQRLSRNFATAMEDLAIGLLQIAEQLVALTQASEPLPIPVRAATARRR